MEAVGENGVSERPLLERVKVEQFSGREGAGLLEPPESKAGQVDFVGFNESSFELGNIDGEAVFWRQRALVEAL